MPKRLGLLLALTLILGAKAAWAGPIFLTGHDPDFHAQDSAGARNLLRAGLSFVTGGTFDDGPATKFLWVESRISPPGGHRTGELGLNAIGLTLGTNYMRADASELPSVDFSKFTAIAIASTFGGLLRQAELDALIARKDDIKKFVNAGGGLLALAECAAGNPACQADLAGSDLSSLYGFLPVTISSIPPTLPFHVTAFGAAPPFSLTDGDVNDPTHNSFGLIGGLTPVDLDSNHTAPQATTLAGNVTISDGGFDGSTSVPEPSALFLLGSGLAGLGGVAWRRTRRS